MARLLVQVDECAGTAGGCEPACFRLGEQPIEVAEIIDRWYGPDHRYLKLRGTDGALYILRHDETADEWELTFYDSRG